MNTRQQHRLSAGAFTLILLSSAVHSESSSGLSSELSSELAWSDAPAALSKAEVQLQSEWQYRTADTSFNLQPRLRADFSDTLYAEQPSGRTDNYPAGSLHSNGPLAQWDNVRFDLAEAYADQYICGMSLRSGKQQVVWGQADGLRVLDIINPQDLREFNLPDAEDSRIATWMFNAHIPLPNEQSLQWLIIPDLTFSELAEPGTAFAITSPELAPQPVAGVAVNQRPTRRPDGNDWEYGLRWSAFTAGWDISASYFNFYHDTAVTYRILNSSAGSSLPAVDVESVYRRSRLLGLSASKAFNSVVLRLEAGHISRAFFLRDDLQNNGISQSPELATVTALDYQAPADVFVSYQFYQSRILAYRPQMIRREISTRHTLLLKKTLLNDTLELSFFALLNRDYNDGQLRSKVSYQLNDRWSLWSGADYFFGNRAGPFGQFSSSSRFLIGWQSAF
ncbi:DUF1302 family protein [Thalassolituus sp. UBA2009]|uniref:DUF1302 family protein n=1 Tax=Thalassolituus sp. UBA2009 TaxID=1947658 RepID=UPI00257D0F0C|nr:DUF1302 family protein [Thalassolituus sp. UBA2009]